MQEWDPIGVRGEPAARDEYDSYVVEAYEMLMEKRADAPTIAAVLSDIATVRIGLSNTTDGAENCKRVAGLLTAMRPEFDSH